MESIKVAGKSLLTLINDILDLSKIEANRLEIKLTAVNITTVLHEIEIIFKTKIERRDIKFTVDIDPTIPSALLLDEVRVRQILLNLIGNADKFTENGYIKLTAQLEKKMESEETALVFTVEDSGIGIPYEEIDKVFEAFKQHEKHDTKKFGGTGLGLSISKSLVEAMGGEISVTSKPGIGSTFKLILNDIQTVPIELSQNESSPQNLKNTSFENAEILIVDDIESNRYMISEILIELGLSVSFAENGQEALDLVDEKKPDLILMDMKMPVMDGKEATSKLKSNPQTDEIPVVALTASSILEDKEKIMKNGFDAYLAKPFKIGDLIHTLSQFLKLSLSNTADSEPAVPESASDSEVNFDNVHEPKLLMEVLNHDILPSGNTLIKTMVMSKIKTFGEKIVAIADKHNIISVKKCGMKLIDDSGNFDPMSTKEDLNELNNIIEQLNNFECPDDV